MSTTNTTAERRESSCPYAAAVALTDDDESSSNSHEHPTTLAQLSACPAFASGSCPFKDVHSAEEVRAKLVDIPSSHFDPSGQFYRVIRELHNVNAVEGYHLPGGCPVQPVAEQVAQRQIVDFPTAMEDLSLASIMARLAKQQGDEEDDDEEEDTEPDENQAPDVKPFEPTPATPPSSSTTRRQSLSVSLKTGTAVSHQAAEDVHFVRDFIKGKIDRRLYGELVVALYHVYAALEACLNEHAPKHFGSCHFPQQLARTATLEEDLDFWKGTSDNLPMCAATKDYVDRIYEIAKTDPLLLLAHSYTRYLGDLSGGRILARVAKRAMQLDGDGLSFYDFAEIDSPKKFKDAYRTALDELPLDQAQVNRLVGEANVAFLLNMRVFEELDVLGGVPGAKVRPLEEALAYGDMDQAAAKTAAAGAEECPFMKQAATSQSSEGQAHAGGGKCPWPFILLHDPKEGMRDWKSWAMMGVILGIVWSFLK